MKKNLLLLIGAISVSITSNAQIPTSGLVAEFLFSGNPNNSFGFVTPPVIVGDVTLTEDRFGAINSAYNFGGNGYIDEGKILGINNLGGSGVNSAFSFSYWLSLESISNVGVALNTSFNNYSIVEVVQEYGDFFQSYDNQSSSPIIQYYNWSSSILENEWFHVVTSYDGNAFRHYINGVLIVPAYGVGSYQLSTISDAITFLGRYVSYNSAYFNGKIDDILVYNRALTDFEILSIYNESASIDGLSTLNFKISPNPTTDVLNITDDNDNDGEYQILDLYGRQVITTFDKSIDVRTLKSGRYLLKANETVVPFVKE